MDIPNGGAWCTVCSAGGVRYEQVAVGGSLDPRHTRSNQGRYAGDAQGSSVALFAGSMNVDRFGSFATEIDCPRYVRFSSDSDHIAGAATGRKSATTGLMHRSKQPLRSITSSAAPSS